MTTKIFVCHFKIRPKTVPGTDQLFSDRLHKPVWKREQRERRQAQRLEKSDEIRSFDWNKTAISFWFFKISLLNFSVFFESEFRRIFGFFSDQKIGQSEEKVAGGTHSIAFCGWHTLYYYPPIRSWQLSGGFKYCIDQTQDHNCKGHVRFENSLRKFLLFSIPKWSFSKTYFYFPTESMVLVNAHPKNAHPF